MSVADPVREFFAEMGRRSGAARRQRSRYTLAIEEACDGMIRDPLRPSNRQIARALADRFGVSVSHDWVRARRARIAA